MNCREGKGKGKRRARQWVGEILTVCSAESGQPGMTPSRGRCWLVALFSKPFMEVWNAVSLDPRYQTPHIPHIPHIPHNLHR